MIDEAVGKILGMVMAYGASALGMFVAYVNYRKRIVKADRVMTGTAWVVVIVSVLGVVGGAVAMIQMASPEAGLVEELITEPPTPIEAEPVEPAPEEPAPPRAGWTWVGILVPAAIFLFATVVTAALHRHFSRVETTG
ncbi:MAG: hypothetical protein R3244_10055 [Thermoanaerobaculia bacterium]|nr:hypothetical protein [Thermoanaerobaculia bacterium]